jgi:ABC-type antimicrobial peptide transport system permease subunit
VYVPIDINSARQFYLTASTDGERAAAEAAIETAARGAGSDVPVGELQSISEMLDYVRKFMETLGTLAVLGGLGAIVVVTIGLYGLVSFDVRRRLPEFAVRLALGARTQWLWVGVLRKAFLLILPGVVLGMGLTFFATPLLGVFLGGTDSHDPRVFGGALAIYGLIVLAAAGLPAYRAASCNPVDVLREE